MIAKVDPPAGVEGGEIILACEGIEPRSWQDIAVTFDGVPSRIESASAARVVAPVPVGPHGQVELRIEQGGAVSDSVTFHTAEKLADGLHPVANPAFDHDNGTIFTTMSGSRGQEVSVSVYKITPGGGTQPFLSDLMNPTGIAFDPDGQLFVTSRYDGTVYRVSPFKEAEPFARNLGVATGIAFDTQGRMFVGDRSGTIFQVSEIGDETSFATLEPSMAAYHLAFGPDGGLYVTGPTASSYDSVYRVGNDGSVTNYFTGLGRPQGLAFDSDGNLFVVASHRARRGVFRITPDGQISMAVAGASLVGLCFDDSGNLIIASTRDIYRVHVGARAYWPF
ncbi:MAG TPA: gluconolaconase [Blastocatellia bacterium]|nr:gluconolaconase [Blastocatellia bacterium]